MTPGRGAGRPAGRARPVRRRPGRAASRRQLAEIDELIAGYAIDWTLDRMPVIDRTLLRMATFELLARPDVPTGVVISEAVELAKVYSTEESGRFVNGVLASIAAAVRAPGAEQRWRPLVYVGA